MCLASKYIGQIENSVKGINSDIKKLYTKLSDYDKRLSKKYHEIEVANFNACEGFYHSKQLQEILQKRRLIKTEIERLELTKKYLSQSVDQRIENAKKAIVKSEEFATEWRTNFKYSFSDIEQEVLH